MAADALGNDLKAVDVPVTGFAAVNFSATKMPTEADLKGAALPSGYTFVGLFTEDGGYAEESEPGETTGFFQHGYNLRTGNETISGSITFAENNATVRKLLGFDGTKRTSVGYGEKFGLIVKTWHRNGTYEARGGFAIVEEVSPSQEERGTIDSFEVKFRWLECPTGGHYSYSTGTAAAPAPC